MIKFPYKTNQRYRCFQSDVGRIVRRLHNISKEYYGVIPYVFIQRCLINRKEKKVVCWNRKPKYIASIDTVTSKSRKAIPFTDSVIKNFALSAIEKMEKNCPDFLCDGIIRIDIMYCPILERLFVNEIESLEAFFTGEGEFGTATFLKEYHYKKLASCLDELKCK